VSAPVAPEKGRFLPSVDHLETAIHNGKRALDAGRFDDALREFNAALRLKPEYDAAWILRGTALRRLGDHDGALQSFAQALKSNRESEEGWMGLAGILHDLSRHKEEIEAYDELLKLRPRLAEAWINKGAAFHSLGDFDAAIACYDEVLSFRPESAAAWNNKGAALLRLGREGEATRCFEEALHFHPDFFDAMVNRAFVSQKRGRHGETVLWANRALRIKDAGWLWYVKGLAHLALLEATLAITSFEKALALGANAKEARRALRKARALREKVDFYRGVYECFGTHLDGDPGCAECEIVPRCREVTR